MTTGNWSYRNSLTPIRHPKKYFFVCNVALLRKYTIIVLVAMTEFLCSQKEVLVGVYHSFDFQDFRRENQGEMFEKY